MGPNIDNILRSLLQGLLKGPLIFGNTLRRGGQHGRGHAQRVGGRGDRCWRRTAGAGLQEQEGFLDDGFPAVGAPRGQVHGPGHTEKDGESGGEGHGPMKPPTGCGDEVVSQ